MKIIKAILLLLGLMTLFQILFVVFYVALVTINYSGDYFRAYCPLKSCWDTGTDIVLERGKSLTGTVGENGIRVDIEKILRAKYTDPIELQLTMDYAKQSQDILHADLNDTDTLRAMFYERSETLMCLFDVFRGETGQRNSYTVYKEITRFTYNTPKRYKRDREYSHSHKLSSWSLSNCPTERITSKESHLP